MFFPIKFKTSVQLAPVDLRDDFDAVIMAKLRRNLEGICSRYGFIKAGSLEILKRSAGKLMKQHFNGYIQFMVLCKGEVCNPTKDSIIKARVVNKNALGILAESYIEGSDIPVLDIIVPKKTAGIISEIEVEDISIGEDIFIMVIGKRFQLNDKKISIIGRVVGDPGKINADEDPAEDEAEVGEEDEGYDEGGGEAEDAEGDEDGEDAEDGEDEDDADADEGDGEGGDDDAEGGAEIPADYDDFANDVKGLSLLSEDEDDLDDLDADGSDADDADADGGGDDEFSDG